MILTNKAREDFESYLSQIYGKFETVTFQECASAPQYPIFLEEINLPESVEQAEKQVGCKLLYGWYTKHPVAEDVVESLSRNKNVFPQRWNLRVAPITTN